MRILKLVLIVTVSVALFACASSDTKPMGKAQNACEEVELSAKFVGASRSEAMGMCEANSACRYIAPLMCFCPKDAACICAGSDAKCIPK